MNKNTTSMDFDSVAKAGSVMSHEITHMFGNRVEAFAHEAGYFGYQQITEGLARDKLYYGYDEDYARAIVAAAFDRRNWEENTGSKDYWLLKTDGTIIDDGSANLHWEAVKKGTDAEGNPIYKTIWSAGGENKNESLIVLLGGEANARLQLESAGVELTGDETVAELGALIQENMTNSSEAGGALNIAYSAFQLNRDWHGMYQSYIASKDFFDANSVVTGNPANLAAANQGDSVTTKLEYFTLLFEPLKAALPLAGTDYENDPVGFLRDNTTEITGHGLTNGIRVRNEMINDLVAALDATIAQGGTVPPINAGDGGLVLRFQNNTTPGLYLSEHALGLAIDFDHANNGQYFINQESSSNAYFNSYLTKQLGKDPTAARGWSEGQQLAQLISEFPEYLRNRYNTLDSLIQNVELIMPNGVDSWLKKDMYSWQTELNQIQDIWGNNLSFPQPHFGMDEIFTENMRNHFTWGGDWYRWNQFDYMHFEY